MNYKKSHPDLEMRKREADKIREKYPDRIPVICEKSGTSSNNKTYWILEIVYLVPNDLTSYHFNYIIRKRIKLPEKESLYFFVNGKYLLKGDTLMAHAYEQKKDADGFLYITYTEESTLGALPEEQ